MVTARKREKKEKDIIDQLLDNINFKGLTQDAVTKILIIFPTV
jgi:hypothetical protein